MAAAIKVAEATRREDGCRSYSFYRDLENENVFRVFEEWESEEALKLHFETPHMAEFRRVLGDVGIVSRDVKRYIVSDVSTL